MNESIPIATLSGITSLTNLLAELPLPCPLPSKTQESLFSNSNIEEEAKKVVSRPDAAVIHQIKQALRSCKFTSDEIMLKDEVTNNIHGSSTRGNQSVLLNALLSQDSQLFVQENDKLELEDLLGIPPLCHAPLSPKLSPNQTVPLSASPMYAGSPPGLAQANSPYQTLHPSPSGIGSPQQQPMASYTPVPQAFSPQRTSQSNIIGSSHQVPYNPPPPHLQASNTGQQSVSPVKTRRMRQSLSHLSPNQTSPPQYQTPTQQTGSHTVLQTSPRARQANPSVNRSITSTSGLSHMNFATQPASTSQYSPGYNSISALEALASSNGFSVASDTLQNASFSHSSKIVNSTKSSSENIQWPMQQTFGQRTEDSEPKSCSMDGQNSAIEMIDLNSQFSLDRCNLDVGSNINSCQYNVDSTITETIDSGISLPAVKKGSSKKKHMDRSISKTNKHHEKEIIKDYSYDDNTSFTKRNYNSEENQTCLNHTDEDLGETPIKSNTIDLSTSVDLVYLDGEQPNQEVKLSSGYTPLKELQLCIPKLVITKIKERRGSKEIETHSVRTIMPGDEDHSFMKKKRKSSEEIDKPSDAEFEKVRPKKKKKAKAKKPPEPVDTDEIMETATFKRFATALENLFEFDDECGVSYTTEIDDEEPASETLASRTEISELYTETAKLKSLKVIHQVPSDQLMRLISIMERHIRDGLLLKLSGDQEDDEEQKLWRDLCLDRMIRSVESSLVVLNVLTAEDVPKQLYLEEVIERIIRLVKFHLTNTIFPEYDPVYRDPESKDSVFVPKSKRTKSTLPKIRLLTSFYNKMCELVSQLGDLVDIQSLTDTSILQISSLGTAPFFVENISDLQHSSLKLVRSVFRRYVKHRDLILEDIFASLARLPSSKRNMRSYRLNGDESIQMVTALVLQLIQCSVKIPNKDESQSLTTTAEGEENGEEPVKVDQDIIICNSYENALRTAKNFLSMFLNKCSSVGKDEEDFRPLFENFLQDLLLMLNKPDWPVAEVLLTLLGRLLIVTFNNKSLDVSLRVSSIDYLGVVAAHLRKDGVISHQLELDSISDMLIDLLGETSDESDEEISKWDERSPKRVHVLRKALCSYLTNEGQNDAALMFAKKFYIAQWIRDAQIEIERAMRNPSDLPSDIMEGLSTSISFGADSIQKSEEEKQKLHELLDDRMNNIRSSQHMLDYDKALVVSRYLGSSRSFSKSFDGYLGQILRILNENVVAIRTKAMKALSAVVSADPSILSRDDMQKGVHTRLVDMSTSVREAAVELIGRFVLNKPDLIHQYYDMIVERILDTGISVRKRVIKILRDICISHPDFPKVTEICVKIIRRISDEEGIKELVTKVFQQMWFTPEKGVQQEVLLKRVVQMTEVVSACGENTDWFEQLLDNLLRSDEDSVVKSSEEACNQIVQCLVENILRQEESVIATSEGQSSSSQKLVASLTTLYLMSKIKPQLLVNHGATLQPYLSTKCSTQGDYLVIHNVARILELVVPLMKHPSETFLASLEEDLMRLTVKHGQTVVQSCISCLGAVVNKVTHNIKLVKDYFQKYYGFLVKAKLDHSKKNCTSSQTHKPTLLRSLFTLGLLCKHFDFDGDAKLENQQSSTRDKVFAVYIYFCKHEDEEVRHKAISGLGFFCIRYAELLMKDEAKCLYQDILSQPNVSSKLKWQVLKNFQTHLLEEERRLRIQDHEWKKQSDKENLKELGDMQSGQTSAVMQVYLKDILEMFFHQQSQLRTAALTVVNLILRQGLVHPVQCVPYLIAAGTDVDQQTRIKSDQQLTDIDNKYSGFIQMKALAGTKKSFELQKLIHEGKNEPIRGYRKDTSSSLLSHMYSVVRTSRQPRRSLLQSLLRMFDDHKKCKLDLLLYVTDSLAYFPYVIQEEPLFIMHHIDTVLSVSGAHLLQAFKETLLPKSRQVVEGLDPSAPPVVIDDDDDESIEAIIERIPEDTSFAQHCVSAQKCLLLLLLKEHLKELFGLTDSKCHKYSPSAPSKAYDKNVSRKPGVIFNPEQVIDYVVDPRKERPNEELAKIYYEFKCLMMRVDPPDDDSDVDSTGRDSPAVDGQPVVDAEGNVIVKAVVTPKIKVKPRKTPAKGRKTPPVSAKPKPKPKAKKKRRKITIDGDSDEDAEDLDPDFK